VFGWKIVKIIGFIPKENNHNEDNFIKNIFLCLKRRKLMKGREEGRKKEERRFVGLFSRDLCPRSIVHMFWNMIMKKKVTKHITQISERI
jgi:hypothetical protein